MQAVGKIPSQDWLTLSSTMEVMTALMAEGATVRCVGGCVRDAILCVATVDVDIATQDPPEKVMDLLARAGIRAFPVGMAHGAVLAVTPEMSFHVTTLRTDIETFGRHATVEYIDNWEEDARRRDLTMNALYVDMDGTMYDPVGGLPDIEQGRVRFIGTARNRIKEDYLRILRFFRFYAYYGRLNPDADHLMACEHEAFNIKSLSKERVWYEWRRLLSAPDPTDAIALMHKHHVLPHMFPGHIHEKTIAQTLRNLVEVEKMLHRAPCPIRRFASLMEGNVESVTSITKYLPISTKDKKRLKLLTDLLHDLPNIHDQRIATVLLYNHGSDIFEDLVMIQEAQRPEVDKQRIQDAMVISTRWENPSFPLKGRDLLALGLEKGPKIGSILDEAEAWWLEQTCIPDKEACLEWVRRRNNM
ncbi:MAG: CCA tRNA nucleotidyltransferase [Alphaproteobacteria bacterium]